MEEKCLKCGGTLFEEVALDGKGSIAMGEDTPLELELDGMDHFYTCPRCSAKNVVVASRSPQGLPQLRVSHVKDA
jgi:predicted nucleic-acid-binding Zn-ribbon protein